MSITFNRFAKLLSCTAIALAVTMTSLCAENIPTLFIAGDSTAANGVDGQRGWGRHMGAFFDALQIKVDNRARGGRSSKTFVLEGLWDEMLKEVKPGDYVLIQFGHNDGGDVFANKARASLPGIGDETQEGTLADGTKQVAHTFGYYINKMITDVQAKKATPIVLSLTIRNIWKDGKIEDGNTVYSDWEKQVAVKNGVAFIDISTLIKEKYMELGETKVATLFPKDYVHNSDEGAELNAGIVLSTLRNLKGDPMKAYLTAKGKKIQPSRSDVITQAK